MKEKILNLKQKTNADIKEYVNKKRTYLHSQRKGE